MIHKEPDTKGMDDAVIHLPDRPFVEVRERGPRQFDEIPSSELAALMTILARNKPGLVAEALWRQVIETLGFGRMTSNMHERLRQIDRVRPAFEVPESVHESTSQGRLWPRSADGSSDNDPDRIN
jgi:hypothetical protein